MRKLILILGLIFLIGTANAQREQYELLTAVGEYAMGNVGVASKLLEGIKAKSPANGTVHYYLAKCHTTLGNTRAALVAIEAALALMPDAPDLLALKGQLLIDDRQYEAAAAAFEHLSTLRPGDEQALRISAALAMQTGRPLDAIRYTSDYETRFGFDEMMVDLKRSALLASKQYQEALDYMLRASEALPASPGTLIGLADVQAGLGLSIAAVQSYESAVAIDSTRPDGYLALARYYEMSNNTGAYIAVLERIFGLKTVDAATKIGLFEHSFFLPAPYRDHLNAIRRAAQALLFAETHNPAVRLLYGRFLTYIGRIDDAKEHYINLMQAGANDRELYDRLLDIHFYQKEYPKAEALAMAAINHWPKEGQLELRRLSAQWLSGAHDGALKGIATALKTYRAVDSIAVALYEMRGNLYHEQGDTKRSFADYRRALKIDPNNPLVLNNYAYFLSLAGKDLETALAMATKACEIEKDFSTYLDTKAWVLFCLGRYSQAAEVQQSALAVDRTGSGELLLHYGDILYALGDDTLARDYWRRALKAGSEQKTIDERLARPRAVKP